MVSWPRRGGACLAVLASCLAVVPAATADPGVIPIAGGASGSALGDGGSATDATLSNPQQVAVLNDYGFHYRDYVIADYAHCLIRRVTFSDQNEGSDVGSIATIVGTAGTCDEGGAAANTTGTSYAIDHPSSVSATPERQVLFADRNGRVNRWTPAAINGQTANTVTTLA